MHPADPAPLRRCPHPRGEGHGGSEAVPRPLGGLLQTAAGEGGERVRGENPGKSFCLFLSCLIRKCFVAHCGPFRQQLMESEAELLLLFPLVLFFWGFLRKMEDFVSTSQRTHFLTQFNEKVCPNFCPLKPPICCSSFKIILEKTRAHIVCHRRNTLKPLSQFNCCLIKVLLDLCARTGHVG